MRGKILFFLTLTIFAFSVQNYRAHSYQVGEQKSLPVALIGLLDWQELSLRRAMKETPFKVDILDPTKPTDLSRYKFVLLERGILRSIVQWREQMVTAHSQGTKFIALIPSAPESIGGLSVEKPDESLDGYFNQPSIENMKRFLGYAAVKLVGEGGEFLPPIKAPENAIYHPDAPQLFADLKSYTEWRNFDGNKPNIAIVFTEASYFSGNTEVVDELIRQLEKHANVVATYGRLPGDFEPDAIIALQPHGNVRRMLDKVSAPILQGVQLMDMGFEEWSTGTGIKGGTTMAIWVMQPELQGHIEPIVVAYRERTPEGFKMKPIPERISKLAQRALGWAKLKRKPNGEKRVAIIHYAMGAAYLDVPKSLWKLLNAMKEQGYSVDLPESESHLLEMLKSARYPERLDDQQILSRFAHSPHFVGVDADRYKQWFNSLPEKVRSQVVKWWGDPPGNLMVYGGKIWIPCLTLGNVAILPLPPRADPNREDALYHSLDVPPTHLYLAFYWWLKNGWQSDALIHFGTHGTLEFTPLKQAGLSETDFPDLLLFDLPNIYPYMVNNPIEAITARRRGYAVTVSHDIPPIRKTKLTPPLQRLAKFLEGYKQAETESLKAEYRRQIAQLLKPMVKTLPVSLQPPPKLDDEYLERLSDWLHELQHQEAPVGLHVFGEKPDKERVRTAVTAAFRNTLYQHLTKIHSQISEVSIALSGNEATSMAELIIDKIVDGQPVERVALEFNLGGSEETMSLLRRVSLMVERMRQSDELGALLNALQGQLPPSKVGGEPIRNLETLPTGNQIHGLDPDSIPSRAAWELGKRLANQFLASYFQKHGQYPRRVGFVLFGSETIRHQGVMESQILWLLGVEPIWDEGERVVGLKLIPYQQLQRPRIDVVVTVTGQYRDIFGDVLKRLQAAVELAARDEEAAENFVKATAEELQKILKDAGHENKEAQERALLRIFAPPAGVYSSIEQAALSTTDTKKLAEVYIERVGFSYGQDANWGVQQKEVFEYLLRGTDVAVFSRTGRLYGLADTDHPFAWLGGLSLAVKHLAGKSPELIITNMQSNLPEQAQIESARKFLNREVLSRYLNPDWIKGMMGHGYSGAREMSNWLSNLWGWQLTAPETVDETIWRQAYEVYVRDQFNLDLPDWIQRVAPEVAKTIARRLSQAAAQGVLKISPAEYSVLLAMLEGRTIKREVGTNTARETSVTPTLSADLSLSLVNPDVAQAGLSENRGRKNFRPSPISVSPKRSTDGSIVGVKLQEINEGEMPSLPTPSMPLSLTLIGITLFAAGFRKGLLR